MATGIEIAGVVLGVLPLCVAAVQNHRAAIRPVVALFRIKDQYRRGLQDLGVCLVRLENTLQDLLKVTGIAGEINVTRFIEACKQRKWQDKGEEDLLISHLGKKTYELAFVVTIERIKEDIVEILGVLGLPGDVNAAIAQDVVWAKLIFSPLGPNSPNQSSIERKPSLSFKERAAFFTRSGSITKSLKQLKEHTQEISEFAARNPTHAIPVTSGKSSQRAKGLKYSTPLRDIKTHAQRLYTALQSLNVCATHSDHCVNLQLRQVDYPAGHRDTATFTIAFSPTIETRVWKSVDLCVSGNTEDLGIYDNNAAKVKFHLEGPTAVAPVHNAQGQIAHDFCDNVHRAESINACTQYHVNDQSQILVRDGASCAPSVRSSLRQRISIKRFLQARPDSNSKLSIEQTMELGKTIVATFLQLSLTRWLRDNWCSDDVFFLKLDDSIDLEQTYVSTTCSKVTSSVSPPVESPMEDTCRLLGLGVILMEVCSQQAIEDVHASLPSIAQLAYSTNTMRNFTTIREHVMKSRKNMQPCFQTAIGYCMKTIAEGVVNLKDKAMYEQVIENLLLPFQRDLHFWRTSCV